MDWFTDNPVTQALSDFRKTLRETVSSSNAQAVAAENADAFAEADWFLVRNAWATGDISVTTKVLQDAHDGIRALTAGLAISSEPVSDISTKLESLTTSLEGPAGGPVPAPDVDFSGSVIDSKEVLNQQIGNSLCVLLEALVNQFRLCCGGAPHWARLQLTGFLNQIDVNSRPFFDLFLSSRYEGDPCRWLKSKCTIDRYVLLFGRE